MIDICISMVVRIDDKTKEEIINLRKIGFSIGEISKIVGKSKGTLHYWLKNIPFNKKLQHAKSIKPLLENDLFYRKPLSIENKNIIIELRLNNKSIKQISEITQISFSTVAKVVKPLPNPNFRELNILRWKDEAISLFNKFKDESLFLLGIGLYWGEGIKSEKNPSLEICNSDYGIIRQWLKWCKTYIPNRILRFKINLHDIIYSEEAANFWKINCEINEKIKVYKLKKRTNKTDDKIIKKIPYGVMYVSVTQGSLEEYIKMMMWLELLRNKT